MMDKPDTLPDQRDLLVTREGGVVTLTLNRPGRRNALSLGMRDLLIDAIAGIERDRSVHAVLLQGAGEHFCAGGDVKDMAAGSESTPEARLARMRSWHGLITSLARLDRPVVAAVDGTAYGAGLGLALLADIVVVSTRARFSLAFQRWGLVPDFGVTYTLPRVIGLQRARELIMTAREVDAEEAVRLGIALEAIQPELLVARAREIAQALAAASPVANGLTKRMLQVSMQSDLPDMLERESAAQAIAATSSYATQAFDSFVRKEPVAFQWPKAGESPRHSLRQPIEA